MAYLDVSKAKLEAGVRLSHHMVSYGDRPNDYDSVSKCISFVLFSDVSLVSLLSRLPQ